MRQFLLLLGIFILGILLFIAGIWISAPTVITNFLSPKKVTVSQEAPQQEAGDENVPTGLSLSISDQARLNAFVTEQKLLDKNEWTLPDGRLIAGSVNNLQLRATRDVLGLNQEELNGQVAGSVDVGVEGDALVITIQTIPEKLYGITPSQHVQFQFLRIVNDISPKEPKESDGELFNRFMSQESIFVVQ